MRRKLGPLVAAALVALAILPASSEGDAIARANLNGSGVNQNFIAGIGYPIGVAVDAGHVYWADLDADTIGRANLDGTDVRAGPHHRRTGSLRRRGRRPPRLLGELQRGHDRPRQPRRQRTSSRTSSPAPVSPAGVAVDAHHVYWGNYAAGRDRPRQPRRLQRQAGLHHRRRAPAGVAVDSGHVYWANSFPDTIGRANLDGSNAGRTSSPAPATCRTSRSIPVTSIGQTKAVAITATAITRARSAAPISTAAVPISASSLTAPGLRGV